MPWLPHNGDPDDDTASIFAAAPPEPRPANATDRRYWWVRWRKAERTWIATAIVASVCVIAVVLSGTAWLVWQIWLIFDKNH